eukprot:251148-Pyramimonas_sp.AAC.1
MVLSSGDMGLGNAEDRSAREQLPALQLFGVSAVDLVGEMSKSVGSVRAPFDLVEFRNEICR